MPTTYDGTILDQGGGVYNAKSAAYGAKGDGKAVQDGSMSSGSAVLTCSPSGPFVAGDVGKKISVVGAGSSGTPLNTTIFTYTSSTQVTLAASAITTVSGAAVVYGHDDTSALISWLSTFNVSGGIGLLPPGTYLVSGSVSVSANKVTIIGDGATIVPTAVSSVFLRAGSAGAEVSDLKIRGVTIDCTYAGSGVACMSLFIKQRALVEGVLVTSPSDAGIAISGVSGQQTQCTIQKCVISNAGSDGVRLASHVTNSVVHDSQIAGTNSLVTGAGIYLVDGSQCVVSNCFVSNAHDNGIRVGGNDNRIANCYVTDFQDDGIRLTVGTRGVVVGCVVDTWKQGSLAGDCFRATGHTYGRFVGCEGRNGSQGVSIDNGDGPVSNITVSDSFLEANTNDGINISSGSHHVVTGCTCHNNGRDGIHGDSVTVVTISGNHCFDDQTTKTQVYGVRSVGTADYWLVVADTMRAADHKTGSSSLVGSHNVVANNMV